VNKEKRVKWGGGRLTIRFFRQTHQTRQKKEEESKTTPGLRKKTNHQRETIPAEVKKTSKQQEDNAVTSEKLS